MPQYETPSLRIALNFEGELCLGHMDMWQAHVEFIEQTFHASSESAWMMVYLDSEPVTGHCGSDGPSNGCWDGEVMYTTLDSAPHELVHAWTANFHKNRLRLPSLSEGLAERLSGPVRARGSEDFGVADLLAAVNIGDYPRYPANRYADAAHFVAWLLTVYGPDVFIDFYTRVWGGMTEAELSAAADAVFRVTVEELMQSYHENAKDYYPGMGAAACGQGPVVPWKDGAATWPADGSCAEGPFFGFEGLGQWQRVTIEVPVSGTYMLEPGGRWAAVTRCLLEPLDDGELPELKADGIAGDWLFDAVMQGTENQQLDWEHPLELDRGTYEVWVERSHDTLQSSTEMRLRQL